MQPVHRQKDLRGNGLASPQIDEGKFTRISNELLEALARFGANGSQFRVMLYLIRMTYGYQRKCVEISLKKIAESVNMKKPNAYRVLKQLSLSNLITVIQSDNKRHSTYCIQKNYEKWRKIVIQSDNKSKLTPRNDKNNDIKVCQNGVLSNRITPVIQSDNHTPITRKKTYKEKNTKGKKTKQKIILPLLENLKKEYPWLDLKLWAEFREHRSEYFKLTKKLPFTELAEKKAISALKSLVDLGYPQKQIIDKSIMSGWAGLFKPKEDPERELGDF